LDRKYSGSTGELFFTGGGAHTFSNFDREEEGFYTLRQGLYHSVNLVFIRLIRDLVRFHQARLPYDTDAVLAQDDSAVRIQMLTEISDKETRAALYDAYRTYRDLGTQAGVDKILGSRNKSARHLTILFFAWHSGGDAIALSRWLHARGISATGAELSRLLKAYDPSRLNISDYGYLLDRHPLEVWCAGELMRDPSLTWPDLLQRSYKVREIASRWLFKTKNRRAQDLRLRIRFEQDAFTRMLPYWQRLGFPFNNLVPSLATAIGSSADRPIALAELMGIVLNDGVRLPVVRVERLRFAADTPYETIFAPVQPAGQRVMELEVSRALRKVLAGVVQEGTARRLANAFMQTDGSPITVGGKTGSGDNRYETRKSSRAVSRTGTFTFYIGDRYFGVITAYASEDIAANYAFTSALPVAALKVLAPAIVNELALTAPRPASSIYQTH